MSPIFSNIYNHYQKQYPPVNEIGKNPRYNDSCLLSLDEQEVEYLNSEQGLYQTFLKNMLMYRNRLFLIRKESEAAVAELKSFEYKPDLIFLDADKKYSTL